MSNTCPALDAGAGAASGGGEAGVGGEDGVPAHQQVRQPGHGVRHAVPGGRERRAARGRAVQVDPIKPALKAPGTKCFKLTRNKLFSAFAYKFNLRRYSVFLAAVAAVAARLVGVRGVFYRLAAGAYTRPPFGST